MVDASGFYREILERRSGAVNEEELRAIFNVAVAKYLGFQDVCFERHRQDFRRNRVIIEFKAPNFFKSKESNPSFVKAQTQLASKYIPLQAEEDNRALSDYTGVCFDGFSIAYVTMESLDEVRVSKLMPFNEKSADYLAMILENDSRVELTPKNFSQDFGPGSEIANNTLRSLYEFLQSSLLSEDKRSAMLFSEWKSVFLQCTSLGVVGQEKLKQDLKGCGLPVETDPTRLLFVLHTYHALVFKLLAAEVALSNTLIDGIPSSYCSSVIGLDDDTLVHSLDSDIENSRLFRQVNLLNFIEVAFFSWYVDSPSSSVIDAIRKILSRISLYRLTHLKLEQTRDVIKKIYQELVPHALRHDIGEFFTPEWLVEFTLDKIGYAGEEILRSRFLDPCCGSGNFVIHAISRYKKEGKKVGWSSRQILDGITGCIFGFDLNPLAVLSTRINYLIAISDLIEHHSDIEIPCYQADAIYSPSDAAEKGATRVYSIATRQKSIGLELPESLVQNRYMMGKVLERMEDGIVKQLPFNIFMSLLDGENGYKEHPESSTWRPFLEKLYVQLEDLEANSWNRIWCRVIRNYFASVAIGRCQYIASNPPWISWAALPGAYKKKVKPTCEEYRIFSMDRYYGGNELDISAIITYSAVHKWLSSDGCMGLVLTQSHYQSQSSGGFRNFDVLGNPINAISVDDFSAVNPFLGVANKPTVITLVNGSETKFPLTYNVWNKTVSRIDEDEQLQSVREALTVEALEANPLNGEGGRWCILRPGRFDSLRMLEGQDPYHKGRKGITTDLNGAYFVKPLSPGRSSNTIRCQSVPALGKKPVPAIVGEIECDLLYPMLKGAKYIRRFYAQVYEYLAVVPNRKINTSQIPIASDFARSCPNAFRYFKEIDSGPAGELLDNRATWKRNMKATFRKWVDSGRLEFHDIPVYAIDNVGDYTFAPFKVVWAELSKNIVAAVIGSHDLPFEDIGKVIVPDHKVYFAPFENEFEAHYLCALLNSGPISEFIDGFTVKLQVGTLFRHFTLPRFREADPTHQRLGQLSLEAHAEAIQNGGPLDEPRQSREIDQLVSGLIQAH